MRVSYEKLSVLIFQGDLSRKSMEEPSEESKKMRAAEQVASSITQQLVERNIVEGEESTEDGFRLSVLEEEVLRITTARLIQAAEVVARNLSEQLIENMKISGN